VNQIEKEIGMKEKNITKNRAITVTGLLILLLVIGSSVAAAATVTGPTARFIGGVDYPDYGPITAYASQDITFDDQSAAGDYPIAYWAWDFGDGTKVKATTDANQLHAYSAPGTYTVSLTVTTIDPATGKEYKNTDLKTNIVTVVEGAKFSASPKSGNKPLKVTFDDLTAGSHGRYWDFGDGTHSDSPANPVDHVYTEVGNYTVKLTVSSDYGVSTLTDYIKVTELPDAAFEATPTSGNAPLTVTFTDKSANNPTSWAWDFGDGATSDKQNPVHTYSTAGDYTVTLTVSNDGGKTADEETTHIHVGVGADFSTDKTSGNAPLTVTFTDKSTGDITNRLWNFGDGTSSKQTKNPVHTYKNPGIYDSKLTITCKDGSTSSKVVKITVTELVANFTMDNNGVGYAPLWVKFTDTSKGATAWNWDFGDGTTSTKQSPIHQYTKDGTYTVTLKVSNANGGGLYESKTATVTSSPQKIPDADFESNVSKGIAPLDVKFTDKSTGNPTDWVWNFGDGATSTEQNPVHTYKVGNNYKVTLTASNAFGSDSVADFITVGDVVTFAADFSANTAYAPLTVAFTDKSTGNPTKWAWDFGDKSARVKTQNPTHKYSKGGTYIVKLTVTNAAGATASKSVKIVVPKVVKPVASFTASPTSGKAPLTVTFTDTSLNTPTSWKWTFGDGKVSTVQNPVHTYTKVGVYQVKLTVSNAAGTKILTKPGYIVVSK
jgi:PKD repeat protein